MTVSCHFIGYSERSKGFRFYCPDRHTKFAETRHAIFLEDEMVRGSRIPREIALEEKRVCALDGNKSLYLAFVGVVFSQHLGLLLEQLG
jgi:hypothetical protein